MYFFLQSDIFQSVINRVRATQWEIAHTFHGEYAIFVCTSFVVAAMQLLLIEKAENISSKYSVTLSLALTGPTLYIFSGRSVWFAVHANITVPGIDLVITAS